MINKVCDHPLQKAYLVAKSNLVHLEQQERIMEQKYIKENGIVNDDASIPYASWAIEDNERCEKAMADCTQLIIDSGLWAKIVDARKNLQVAEDELLEYGLNIIPENGKSILEKAVTKNMTIRKKMIDFVLKLDTNTVKPL
ncbi:hypothetical protein MKZ21_30865 [Paenibacillus sp. FSL P2-0536]|uniref:hypothetical protein n=1 Tax=Paenibacillus sp. FSL P2-0536 TaxID=2921629 RepID=UPI0030F958B8